MKKRYTGTWESIQQHQVPQWYHDCKLGIFIHWGIYSVPAYAPRTWELGEIAADEQWFCNNPYAEWYYNSVNVGCGPSYEHHVKKYGRDFKYEDFLPMWQAERWNPGEWAELFRLAGARYVVLTTKHHDGFCLYPSQYTDYHSGNMGPQRDLTGELTEAVRAAGLRMGLYYSGLIDWRFADDPIYTEAENFSNACPTYEYADYSYNQMKELVDRYQPSVLWNDIGWPKQSEQAMPYLLAHYYNTVEEGVVNDRFNGLYHDYTTKEYQAGSENREGKWEMCRGMGLSFGYNENEGDDQLLAPDELIQLLVRTVAANGNLLLNIGPRADGTIPEEQVKRLLLLGEWLEVNGEGIYESRCSERHPLEQADSIRIDFTEKGGRQYLFISGLQPGHNRLHIPEMTGPLTPLNAAVEAVSVAAADGIDLEIHNYREEMYTLCFKK